MKKVMEERWFCDLCKKQIIPFNAANTFYFSKGWESGVHKGVIDNEGHVCDKCMKSKLRAWLAFKWINITSNGG